MKFAHGVEVRAPPDRVYAFLLDVPRVARCLPGAEDVRGEGERYAGRLGVRVGPIRLGLSGEVAIVARDDSARTATLRAAGDDARAGGVRALLTMRVSDAEGGSRLTIDSDVQVLGRLGELGLPILKRKADQLIAEFGRNLARELVP